VTVRRLLAEAINSDDTDSAAGIIRAGLVRLNVSLAGRARLSKVVTPEQQIP
jgi:hypothetical protein